MCAHLQIGRVNRDVLRRQALLYDARHLVVGDGGERRVVAVEEGEPHVLVAEEERGARVGRVALAEAEQTLVGALPRRDVLEREAEVFALAALYLDLPLLAAAIEHVQSQLGLAARVKAEIEVVAHHSAVNFHDAVAGLKLQLRAEAAGRDLRDGYAASAYLRDCWRDCELVHLNFSGPAARTENSHRGQIESMTEHARQFNLRGLGREGERR